MSLLSFISLRVSLVIIGLILAASAIGFTLRSRSAASASASSVAGANELPTLRGEAAVEQLKQQGLYASLNEAVARTRYNLHRSEGKELPARLKLSGEVWHATNPAQNMKAYFARDGVKVVERSEGKPAWELGLRVTGYGYGKQLHELEPGEMRAENNRIEYTRPAISQDSAIRNSNSAIKEWYINSQEGVEQGFTIAAPGEKPVGEALRVRMELAAGWKAELAANGQAITLAGQRGQQLHYNKLVAWDANQQPLKAWMEVEGQEVRLAVDDANAVYPVTIDPTLSQQAKLTASNGAAGDQLGRSVAISGTTVVVGADRDDVGANTDQGSAYVFVRSGSAWTLQEQLTTGDGRASDQFGISVAISGETIVVGAMQDRTGNGAAYVFVRSGSIWLPQQKLTASDGEFDDRFGHAVGISGETIVVGAYLDDLAANNQGSAYVFVRNGTTWTQQQKLSASDGAFSDWFGFSVAIHEETIVVGSSKDDLGTGTDQGSAFVFVRVGSVWSQQQKLIAPDAEASDEFGNSVAISGDTIVVGAHNGSLGTPAQCSFAGACKEGAAYVFIRSSNIWTIQQRLKAVNDTASDEFGTSVAISREMIVVGAIFATDFGDAGAAYVFTRRGTNWVQQIQPLLSTDGESGDQLGIAVAIDNGTVIAGANGDRIGTNAGQGSAYIFTCADTWAEQTRLTAADGASFDNFGYSVGISGDTAIIGAYNDDVGANVNQGSAYVFVRNGTGWTQQQQITAGDGAAGEWFGYSVAISGETLAVGAIRDGSGNEGAVYVFVRTGTTWTQQQKFIGSNGGRFSNFGSPLAISGNTIVVGNSTEAVGTNGGQGVAYVFVRVGTIWTQQQRITSSDGLGGDGFGSSVAISGETLAVGTPFDDVGTSTNQGSAYVFVRSGANWIQQAKLTANDGAGDDRFGISVGVSGDTVVVGAHYDDVGANADQGSAYVFVRNGASWLQQQQLTTTLGSAADYFGTSVGISGETIVVGAYLDDIGGSSNQGSAFVFTRSGTSWTERPRLTASEGAQGDQFGYAVAISGDTVIVATPYNGIGSNGEQGSAYIFVPDACGMSSSGPDLTLTKSDGDASALPGTTIIYNLNYANVGVAQATGVTLSETVPVGTTFNAGASSPGWACAPNGNAGANCTLSLGTVSIGENGVRRFAVTVDTSVPAGLNQISNTASIFDDGRNGTDPTLPNTASDATPLNAIPALTITKTDGGVRGTPGSTIVYALGYANVGNQGATGVVITETVPANTTFNAAASTSGWSCAGANCTFNVGAVNSTGVGAINFAVTINAVLPSGVQEINNTARITDDGTNSTLPITASASATTPININRPVANNDLYATNKDTALTVAAPGVLANDTGAGTLTAVLVTAPTSGALTLNANGSFTFTPAANFSGSVNFVYKANDGASDSNNATVTITVKAGNSAPVANPDTKATNEDTALSFPASDLLANDTDPDNDTLTVTSVAGANNGTVALSSGVIRFTPAANLNSPSTSFSFSYNISDGKGGTASNTVNVTVNAINDAPGFTLVGNPPLSIAGINNVIGYARNISAGPPDEVAQALTFRLTVISTTGGLSFAAAPAMNAATGNLTFTITPNTSGTAIVSAVLMDSGSGVAPNVNTSAPQTFTITVNTVVNTPPIARNDSYTMDEDTTLTVPAPGVRANDTDAEGSPLTAVLVTAPSSGRLTFSSDGSFIYTPVANFFGMVTFAYLVNDGAANSNPAVVTITVNPINDAPDAMDDEAISLRNTPVTINVLANDANPAESGETLRVLSVTQGMLGAVTLNPDGTLTYTPGALFTGRDMFTYTLGDGNGGTDTATVSVEGSHLLDPTPLNVLPGGEVTIKWTVPEGSAARDWIGFFRAGEPNSSYDRSRWFYTNGAATGSRTIRMPQTPGQYEFRYFLDNGFTLVSRSVAITVGTPTCPTITNLSRTSGGVRSSVLLTGSGFAGVTAVSFGGANARFLVIRDSLIIAIVPASALTGPITLTKANCPAAQSAVFTVNSNYSLSASPASIAPGGSVTVRWTAPAGNNARDRIGLFSIGDRNPQPVSVFNTDGATSGSRAVTMPTTPGQYEFRFLGNRRWGGVRASLPVTVTAP